MSRKVCQKKVHLVVDYREKEYNLDTIEVNAIQTSGVLGVHAPLQVQLPIFSLEENKP